jgi:hypothetical protein
MDMGNLLGLRRFNLREKMSWVPGDQGLREVKQMRAKYLAVPVIIGQDVTS